jgi:O-acetyl-ADP-ribose deacetylase (regulator of RNase III)
VDKSKLRIVVKETRFVEFHGPADIALETTEAIVNAANSHLLGGGGVDGAIHDAAGPSLLEECRKYVASRGYLPAGQAMITSGGRLSAKYVIHTVGPVYRGGQNREHELLASCHRESVRVAEDYKLKSVAFPAISTGAYGYPVHEAAAVAVHAVVDALETATYVERVRFVLFDIAALKAYVNAAKALVKDMDLCRVEEVSDYQSL